MLTRVETMEIQTFAQKFQIRDAASWAFLADLFLEVDRGSRDYFAREYPEYPALFDALQGLLSSNETLQQCFAALKEAHGRVRKNGKSEEAERLISEEIVFAIINFAEAFLGCVRAIDLH